MNLWAFVSSIVISLGLTVTPFYHLPTFDLVTGEENDRIVVDETVFSADKTDIPHKAYNQSLGVKISAQAAAVVDERTGTVLWQKNANEVRSIASITKLMTALVFLQNNPGWDTEVTMLPEDNTNGGTHHILEGERVTAENLFYAGLIASDNNSIKALVRSTGLTEEEFVGKMNNRARTLGLINTNFVEPTGLDEDNKSTALEVLKLAQYAFGKDTIVDAVELSTYTFQAKSGQHHKIYSTNKLLDSYLDIVAGKTGYIGASGYCLTAQVKGEEGQRILAVVLGSDSHDGRFYDLKVLSGWVLENFTWY